MSIDLVIRRALVYPGEGPPSIADVAVADGRIEAVAPSLGEIEAIEVLDGGGLMLTPGFIDMHAHSALRSFDEPLLEPKIAQGFTTELINPDGLAPAPVAPDRRGERRAYLRGLEGSGPEEWPWSTFAEYLDALADSRPATTLVPSIGHNSVRDAVMGGERRAPTACELRRMQDEVRLGLEAGARTLSFGLLYLPGAYADTDELVALAEVAAEFGAPLVPHVRNEGRDVLGAVGEFIEVARRSRAPLHVSHLKSAADEALIEPLLQLLDEASADVDLSFDQYPYGAGSTVLSALLPAWAQEGGASATLARLRSEDDRRRIAQDMEHGLPAWENWFGMVGPGAHRCCERRPSERERCRADARRTGGGPRRRAGRARVRSPERIRAGRDDAPALRVRGGCAANRRAPAPAGRLGRDLRDQAPPAAVRDGGAVPGTVRNP